MYDPIGGFERSKQFFQSYLDTAFRIDDPVMAGRRRELLAQDGSLALNPIFEAVLRYEQHELGLEDLVGNQGHSVLPGFDSDQRRAFVELALAGLFEREEGAELKGKYRPYRHQIDMLRRGVQDGMPGIVTSGTGSGKTESFMLPILAALAREAVEWAAPTGPLSPAWFEARKRYKEKREAEANSRPKAVRALILYPMNALVEDQMTRLRKALDSEAAHEVMDRRFAGNRIFFGRYTGKTPVTGFRNHPRLADDENWQKRTERRRTELRRELRIMDSVQKQVRQSDQERRAVDPMAEEQRYLFADPRGSEMISRWDMQDAPPDILVTNQAILNAMLVREVENDIIEKTRNWLVRTESARFHLVLDELHLVRGSGGAEVAGLLRVLLSRLGLDHPDHRHKLRILASSASLPVDGPDEDASLEYLENMFGAAGTHRRAADEVSPIRDRWKGAIVTGSPEKCEEAKGDLDPAPLAAIARAVDGLDGCDADPVAFQNALDGAVVSIVGSTTASQEAYGEAVRRVSFHLARVLGGDDPKPAASGEITERLFGSREVDAFRGLTIVRAIPDLPTKMLGEDRRPSKSAVAGLPSFRVHTFVRNIDGLFASVARTDDGFEWGYPSIERGEAFDVAADGLPARRRFELLYCEACGDLFLGGRRGGAANGPTVSLLPTPQELERLPESATTDRFEDANYLDFAVFWPARSSAATDDPQYTWTKGYLEPTTGFVRSVETEGSVEGFLLRRKGDADRHGRRETDGGTAVPYCCPRCSTDYSPRFQARNSLKREGRLSPIRSFRTGLGKTSQLLATELVAYLKAQGGDGKIVAFSDSRRDAATLALDVEVQHQRDLRRELLAVAASEKDRKEVASDDDRALHADLTARLMTKIGEGQFGTPEVDALGRDIKRLKILLDGQAFPASFPLQDILEFFRGHDAEELAVRPVLRALLAIGANPNEGADTPKNRLGRKPWNRYFTKSDDGFVWIDRKDLDEKEDATTARRRLFEGQRVEAADLLFSRTYFALEETGLGYPSFFGRETYGEREMRFDAWLRIFADAYRVIPNRFTSKKEGKASYFPWSVASDAIGKKGGNRLAQLLERILPGKSIEELDQFLDWLRKRDGDSSEGRIDVTSLNYRPVAPDSPSWRCSNCSRVHLHLGLKACTRCGNPLRVEESTRADEVRNSNFLGRRVVRALSEGDRSFRLRCEELTGQTGEPSERLQRFRGIFVKEEDEGVDAFELRKSAQEIDLLSVTTTMEVGVDIGALQAVYQANMPPQRFNYQQRVGRAGRRGQAFSTVLTVCRSRSHDIHYFRHPLRITGDAPPPPFLTTGLADIPSRILRKFWLVAAFELLRHEAGANWAGDALVPPDIHGEFVSCGEWFAPRSGWPELLRSALSRTDAKRVAYAESLAIAARIGPGRLLELVTVESILGEIEGLRRDYSGRFSGADEEGGETTTEIASIGLASAMAESGLLPLYGMPTRTRNLYLGHRVKRAEGGTEPVWDTIDRDQDMAISEFAPGSVIPKDKERHLCVGFTGALPKPNGRESWLEPMQSWAQDHYFLSFCEKCGNWEKSVGPVRAEKCGTCGSALEPERARECISPAAYRTDFTPKADDLKSRPRRILTLANVGMPEEIDEDRNLIVGFTEHGRVHVVNPGEDNDDGEPKGFDIVEARDTKGISWSEQDWRKRTIFPRNRLSGQAVDRSIVSTDDKEETPRWVLDEDRALRGWLASSKVTNALQISTNRFDGRLRLADLESSEVFRRSDQSKTSVRAAAISATQIIVQRASLELDVAPEEFESLAPKAVYFRGQLRPFLQIADTLPNGSGFCRQLQKGGTWSVDALIASILADVGHWPLSAVIDRDHASKCAMSCYRCLQRFNNRSMHGLLDWRLGMSYLRAMRDPGYACGLVEGEFDAYPELLDWKLWAGKHAEEARTFVPGSRTSKMGRLNLPAFTIDQDREMWVCVVHPLWRRDGIHQELDLPAGAQTIDTFELARRPLWAIKQARGD